LKCCPSTDPVTLNDQDSLRKPKKQNKVNQTENEDIWPGGSPKSPQLGGIIVRERRIQK